MDSASSQGRTYLVTGSASGIGAATARLIGHRGGRVIGVDLKDADIEADLSTAAGRKTLVEQARRRGRIDAVLAIAGGSQRGIIETNFFGTVATLAGLRALLAESPTARAVAVSSTASLSPADQRVVEACLAGDEEAAVRFANETLPGSVPGPYGYAKRALNRWVRRMAPTAEWAGAGIALNAVAPGVVDTPAAAWIMGSPEARAAVEAAAPQPFGGFPGRPEWIAEVILWLASEANQFVTGQVIFADGGAEAAAVGDRHWT
jgi:NAD(P)-dependent dehydrogenase (short-subunit alcohol dehydrogenase family)